MYDPDEYSPSVNIILLKTRVDDVVGTLSVIKLSSSLTRQNNN